MTRPITPGITRAAAQLVVISAFSGRKGHGGDRCTKRVMTPTQLRTFAISAIEQAVKIAAREGTTF